MGGAVSLNKVSISLYRERSGEVIAALGRIGVRDVNVEAGRSLLLTKATGLKKLFSSSQPLDEESVSVFSFFVEPEFGRPALAFLVEALGLDLPGRGSVWIQEVERLGTSEKRDSAAPVIPACPDRVVSADLAGLACIMQKGEINPVARIGLTTGTAIPVITYGTGTGLRNRLGPWRILIPAEKEACTMVMDAADAEAVMEMMVDAGRLDLPGKGFISTYPIQSGILDTKFQVGSESQAASIEQMIAAIDEVKGTTEWRRKSIVRRGGGGKGRKYLEGLAELTILCNEGQVEHFTQVAMEAGASGATYRRLRHLDLGGDPSSVSPAREASVLTVGPAQVAAIAAALEEAGLYETEHSGELYRNPVSRACTYLGK